MPSITDVPGVLVGHAHDMASLTGCTVVLPPARTIGGVDVRGGAPGTRETDLLDPANRIEVVNAIALCGGSAYGLAAANGVMRWLREQGRGHVTPAGLVPIVPAAVIFDLAIGRNDRWADDHLGYAACEAAGIQVAEGCVGVGTGATSGKLLGMQAATKTGVGTWSETLADGTTVGALVVCNAFGDVRREADGTILAGVRDLATGGFADCRKLLRTPGAVERMAELALANTTLAVVATDARLTKAQATKLAQMAQDGIARAIYPCHTPFDGDAVFALSTGARSPQHLTLLGSIAADVLVHAIERAATRATGIGGLPAGHEV